MTDNKSPESGTSLQFDKAEGSAGGGACAMCKTALSDSYYEINGKPACAACREKIEQALTSGSKSGRFFKAALFGIGAGIAGALLWYVVTRVTGHELGLIAIAVGFLVGKAVSIGSGRKGGWLYQLIAMVLTYCAIVSTYIPIMYQGYRQSRDAQAQSVQAPGPQVGPAAEPAAPPMGRAARAVGLAVMLVVFFVIALAVPFMAGIPNVMGIIIIGIALYEAWMLNRRVAIRITGPYQVAGQPPGLPTAPA